MIPQITEINFPAYATLHQAVVNLSEMGERTITTQVRIDGDVTPSFSGMELSFKGERFVLPSDTPQAAKDNTTRNSLVDLVFESAPVQDLKRYFFFEPTSVNSSTAIADKYKASVNLNIEDFVVLLNKVLKYYFGTSIVASLYMSGQGYYSSDWKAFEIDYSKIWDVITKLYDVYGVRWRFSTSGGVTTIQINYPDEEIQSSSHIFEYGYSGGLLKFERQVQDQDLVNILLGRGGEKNLPYRYFKKVDPLNDSWSADPDAIPELANIYFDRLRDINFRNYIQGWKTNPNRDTTTWPGTVVETYDSSRGATDWAYKKGHEDIVFNPVEYVKDDDSIAAYGEHWGALEDNDDIYPTIQGRTRHGLGRIDEVVSVSPITTDDITGTAGAASVEQNINSMRINVENDSRRTFELISEEFTVPTGMRGNVTYIPLSKPSANESLVYYDTEHTVVTAIPATGNDVPISGLTPGTYKLRLSLTIYADQSVSTISGTFGIEGIVLHVAPPDSESWKPTFDIWVKNIWNTTKGQNESAVEYSQRVWGPILGDRAGNEAKVVFSTGFMSVSEDYEFTIADYPIFDQSHQVQTKDDDGTTTITVPSEWKITLRKSDAEYDATGLFIPNSTTGGSPVAKDKFFFIGIDMPHDYVVWAEEELNTYKNTNLGEHSDVNPTWVISLDKIRINTLEDADNGSLLADLLSSGTKITIKDSRFAPTQMQLYVRQITYTWNEPTDEKPYLFPDVEVVLSENVMSSVSSYAKLQGEVSTIKSEYVRVSDVESVVRQVASPMFLKKTGEDDSSASPTTFASKVSSSGFRQGGVGGAGWGLYADNSRQLDEEDPDIPEDSVFEVDKLVVRKQMEVNSLVINQISYMGGKEIISAAKIEVTNVVDNGTTYTCYFDQRQGTVKNLFVAGDIAYGQVYNPGNTSIRYYKYVVDSVDVDRIVLLKSSADTGSVAPQVGDVIVQYGNTDSTNHADRQYVIIRDIIGGGYERMLSGLNSVSAAGTEYYFAGRQNGSEPRWFVGDRASNQYLEYANGKLTISGVLDVTDTEESTTIQGNIIQTGTIQLGDVDEYDHFQVYSGISGDFDNNALGNGIAAWYGGPKVDHDASPSAQSYARSIFRFDGSGYLAGGMLKWGVENGEAFLNLNGENVTVGLGDVNLNDIANLLFDVVSIGNNRYAVKLRTQAYDSNGHTVQIDGLFTDGFMSAGGLNADAGGGGGVSNLWALDDVKHGSTGVLRSDGTPVNDGDILVYGTIATNTKGWYAKPENSSGGGGTVTSVGLQAASGSGLSVSGSPITASGTFTIGIDSSHYLPLSTDKAAWDAKQNALTADSDYLTPTTAESTYVPTTRKVNNKALSADITLSASDVGALASNTVYVNKVTVGTTDYTPTSGVVTLPAYPTVNNATLTVKMNNASKGTFTANAASNVEIDLGTVITSHQSIYALTIKNSAGTTQLTYTPNSAAGSLTLTKAMVGLSDVDNLAASAYFTDLSNITTGANANKISATIGTTTRYLTVNYATNAGSASSASRLSGNTAYSIWGQTYWQNGVPGNVTGQPTLYIARNQVATYAGDATLYGISGFTSAASASNTDKARVVWDSDAEAWHFYGGIYSDSFVSAGGLNSGSGGGGGVENLWALHDVYSVNGAIVHADDSALANGDVLTYNSTKGKWVAAPTAAAGITGITMNGSAVSVDGSGVANLGTVITSHQDISGKADKVSSPTNGNFAALDSNGNLTDSGHKHSDYLTSHQSLGLVAGASGGTANATTTNGNTYINLLGGGVNKGAVKLTGATNVSVASDNSGNITITGPDLSNYQVKVSALGNVEKPVYISAAGTFSACYKYAGGSVVRLNGTLKDEKEARIYAPTPAAGQDNDTNASGLVGQILVSSGLNNAPTWRSEVFIDKTNSRVGIGTTSPSYKLHVSGSECVDDLYINGNNHIYLGTDMDAYLFRTSGDVVKLASEVGNIELHSYGYSVSLIGEYINLTPASGNFVKIEGNVRPGATESYNLGSSGSVWKNLWVKRWYPNPGDSNHYIEYDSTNGYFYVQGDFVVSGAVVAGQASNS